MPLPVLLWLAAWRSRSGHRRSWPAWCPPPDMCL